MKRSIYAIIPALAGLVWTPSIARADKEVATGEKTVGLEAALEGLRWSASTTEVLAHFEAKLWDDYKSKKRVLPGPLEIDRLREQTQQKVMQVRQRLAQLTRESKDYRVSIIDRDFKRGTGEAVLRDDADQAQRYWFFVRDRLWKLVIAFNAEVVAGQDVPGFAIKLRQRYGKPVDQEFARIGGRDVVVAVKWADETTQLTLQDRIDPYGTFTLTFVSRDLAGRLTELRGELGSAGTGDDDTSDLSSSLIDDITQESASDSAESVVDDIIGGTPDAKPRSPTGPDEPVPPADDSPAGEGDDDGPIIY